MIGQVHDVEILWDDLLDAFGNNNGQKIYFLDRETGEVFLVPRNYDDSDFWSEVRKNRDRFLKIPLFDAEQERFLIRHFLNDVQDLSLRRIIDSIHFGRNCYGKIADILEFYPDEREKFVQLREEFTTGRISSWLEANDLVPVDHTL